MGVTAKLQTDWAGTSHPLHFIHVSGCGPFWPAKELTLEQAAAVASLVDVIEEVGGVKFNKPRPDATGPLPRFRYTGNEDLKVLHDIDLGDGANLRVIGLPDYGAYEWVITHGDEQEHSDCGYGDSSIALRDGLCAFHGNASELGIHKRKVHVV
jgi:hypothetical protein